MIVVKTPLRVSFFGGGTDLPEYFLGSGGAVLGTAIDKHIFHLITRFPSEIFDYSIRLAYRNVERVKHLDDIKHKPFREILRFCGIQKDVEVSLTADLPSFSGLGSSSAFTAGLIHGLHAFQGKFIGKLRLAQASIKVERDILKESVGYQDQIFAAYGGLNVITFERNGLFDVHRISLHKTKLEELEKSLLLFYTGITRKAEKIEKRKILNLNSITKNLDQIRKMVDKAFDCLTGGKSLCEFGKLLDSTWKEKRRLDSRVSSPSIDAIYRIGINAGAIGGKLLGAGGGGFMLFFAPMDRHENIRKALKKYFEIPFAIDAAGSSIIHAD